MRNLFLRGGLIVALVAVCLGRDDQFGQTQAGDAPPPSAAGTRAGVLVLNSGQLVEGRLSQSAGGYQVDLPAGSYLVPFEQVQLAADDRHEAYLKLKAMRPNPTPAFQVALARWCMAWKLFKEARLELRGALIAEPDNQAARAMYAGLDQLMHSQPQPQLKTVPQPQPKTADGFQQEEPESLAGLSPESAKLFVIRIQPLLQNRCGNAACHAPPAGRDFQITHVRGRLNRQTLQNLESVLKFVDKTSPKDSPLLKTPTGTHGRIGRPIFLGSVGEQNLETLKDWVTQVAKDLGTDPKDNKNNKDNAKNDPFARRDPFDKEPDETLIRGTPEPAKPLSPEERTAQADDKLLDSILQNEQKDAFDPEEFNRKYGS